MSDIKALTRRQIRSCLFVKKRMASVADKDFKKQVKKLKGEQKAHFISTYRPENLPNYFDELINHFESLDNFTEWQSFSHKDGNDDGCWDVGIDADDLVTKQNRPAKKWLFNHSRFEIFHKSTGI